MLDRGQRALPGRLSRVTRTIAEVRAALPRPASRTPPPGEVVSVAGRVIFVRNTGKLCFATLHDGDGTELQAMLSLDEVGEERLADWKSDVDLGDHVFVTGEVITSPPRRAVACWSTRGQIAAKALRPLPVAHKPLAEETRVRSATSTSSCARRPATMVRTARGRGARRCATRFAAPRLHRGRDADAADCCTAARPPVRSSRTPTRSTPSCTCASRPSCSSSAPSSAASTASSRSTATSATRAPTPRTRRSSRCSRRTRRTATTTRSPT